MDETEIEDIKTDINNDTELQQMMAAQQEQQQQQPQQRPQQQQAGQVQGPAPYDPNNPMIETHLPAINNIMELRKIKLWAPN